MGKKAQRAGAAEEDGDGLLRLLAGGHSAGRCNWFPTDIGIVGSASCGPPTRSPPAAPPPVVRCGESARRGVARERMLERQSESSQ